MKLFAIVSTFLLTFSLTAFAGGEQDKSMEMSPLVEFDGIEKASMLAESDPTVLFFHASWCPSCKSARKDFEQNSAKLEGINLIVVDYDTTKDLQQKYGVTYQHTFVQIDKEGMEIAKWNGGGADELLNNIVKPMM